MQRNATINDDQCRRVMRKFRKRRRERTSSIAALTKLRPTQQFQSQSQSQSQSPFRSHSRGEGIGRLEFLRPKAPRTKRRSPTSTLCSSIYECQDVCEEDEEEYEEEEDEYAVRDIDAIHDGTNFSSRCDTDHNNSSSNNNNNNIHSLLGLVQSGDPRYGLDRRRRGCIEWGERLVRKRAFGGSANKNRSTSNHHSNHQSELVHRKPESLHTFSYYSGCIFLDSYDTVLAVDNRGTIDVLRLADLRATTTRGTRAKSRAETKSATSTSRQATAIATNLELGAELRLGNPQQSFATAHLQALAGGSTVAFGLGDDSLCLVDLEGRTDYTYYTCCNGNGNANEGELRRVPLSTSGHPPSLPSSLFRAWRTQYPVRTYYRNRVNPRLSLHELCLHLDNNCRNNDNNNNNNNNDIEDDHPHSHLLSDLEPIDRTSAYHHNYNNNNNNNNNNNSNHHNGRDRHGYGRTRRRIASTIRFVPGVPPPHNARWDILEARPSVLRSDSLVLYVAHVDSDYDAFWTQVLDGRVRSKNGGSRGMTDTTNNNNNDNTNNANNTTTTTSSHNSRRVSAATTVLVDGTTKDRPGTAEEHVTACALLSELCVATSHISCGRYGSTPASEFFDKGLPYAGYSGMSSCIKLWDLRMTRHKRTSATKRSPIPADVLELLPPTSPDGVLFRHADVFVAEPSATIRTRLASVDGSLAFSEAGFSDRGHRGAGRDRDCERDCESSSSSSSSMLGGSDQVITNLSAARDGGATASRGSLIVTTQSRTKSTHVAHSKLDLGGSANCARARKVRTISQINSNLGCRPVYAIAPSHKHMAICSNRRRGNLGDAHGGGSGGGNRGGGGIGATTRLCLYDMDERRDRVSSRNFSSPVQMEMQLQMQLRRRQQEREDPTFRYKIDAALTDRYGIDTELSCIAMNSNGTAVLGGSTDGDLFVWRGI